MEGKIAHLRRLESSLTKLYVARQMFDAAYPELIGNQPEYKESLDNVLNGFDVATVAALAKIRAVEQSFAPESLPLCDCLVDWPTTEAGKCSMCGKNAIR